MSIASEISRLQGAKADLKTAIESKGVSVSSATKIDGYAALVSSISQSGSGVGDLSNYSEQTITPSDATYIMLNNPFTVRPKIILLSCASDSEAATTANMIFAGAYCIDGVGASGSINTNNVLVPTGYYSADDSTTNTRYGMYNGQIRINRVSAAIQFSTNTAYTLKIYG